MKCATYSRYSTDMQREASIADQVRNCEKHAQREGWQIIRRYADKGISGTKTDRPQYQQMLADAQARKFDIVLVDDLSRLSRDDIETKQSIKRLRYWGTRLIGVSDGFDSDAKGYKVQAAVRGMINEIYIDDLKEKTHRGMVGVALAGALWPLPATADRLRLARPPAVRAVEVGFEAWLQAGTWMVQRAAGN